MTPELLNQLHDIQLPEPIGWWPLAFSWWIMIFSVTSILIGVLWYYFDLKRRNAYRVTAASKLAEIMDDARTLELEKISRINRLLKQVALTAYGRNKTAALQSQDWVRFLHTSCSYIEQPEDLRNILDMGYKNYAEVYGQDIQGALKTLNEYAKKWIKGHHQ